MPRAAPTGRPLPWYFDVRWIAAGLVVAFVATTLFGIFRPDARIVVSPRTTVITQPLAADGLPDYAAHQLARAGRGTPPEENAAVPLLMALWPLEIKAADLPAVCRELGIAVPVPPPQPLGNGPSDDPAVVAAIAESLADRVAGGSPRIEAIDVINSAAVHPWRSADVPALGAWLEAHAGRLDLLVEASRRPRLYLPRPALLRGDRGAEMDSPSGQISLWEGRRLLTTRAMWHLGSGRPAESWHDILAIHRLERLAMADESFDLDSLEARFFLPATLCLLDAPELPADVLAMIRRDLDDLPPFPPRERLIRPDRIRTAASGVRAFTMPRSERMKDPAPPQVRCIFGASLDGNVALKTMNARFDAAEAALGLPAWSDRQQALARLAAAEARSRADVNMAAACGLLLDRGARSAWLASFLSIAKDAQKADTIATRTQAFFDLVRVAAALAAYRAADAAAAYPARLDDLVPRFLARLPTDPFTGGPFVYERSGAGYLLYSLGEDTRDDGGSDEADLVVRMPTPASPVIESIRNAAVRP